MKINYVLCIIKAYFYKNKLKLVIELNCKEFGKNPFKVYKLKIVN